MKHRIPPWLLLLLVVAVCVVATVGVALLRHRTHEAGSLIGRLPSDGAVLLAIDFGALRRGGLLQALAGTGVAEEPEYRAFVERTGFDYLADLDWAAASFHSSGTYFLLRGRFDWKALKDYVAQQGGVCHNLYCTMAGSREQRQISFCPLRGDTMALAVSPDSEAARNLSMRAGGPAPAGTADPVWAEVPIAALADGSRLPAGTRMFASALRGAERMLLSLGQEGGQMRLRADVTCHSTADATALAAQLRTVTTRLQELIAREKQAPNPADLSGLLAAGSFEQKAGHVLGRWPVDRQLLEALAGGRL